MRDLRFQYPLLAFPVSLAYTSITLKFIFDLDTQLLHMTYLRLWPWPSIEQTWWCLEYGKVIGHRWKMSHLWAAWNKGSKITKHIKIEWHCFTCSKWSLFFTSVKLCVSCSSPKPICKENYNIIITQKIKPKKHKVNKTITKQALQ